MIDGDRRDIVYLEQIKPGIPGENSSVLFKKKPSFETKDTRIAQCPFLVQAVKQMRPWLLLES